jgi:hypothetical protein
MPPDELYNSFDHAERIGVIGSPSTTRNLTIDILGIATDKRLVGSLCIFRFRQDNKVNYALGQITEIKLKNTWSEDPTIRGLIRQRGSIEPITEKQDTHVAIMIVGAVFADTLNGYEPSMLGTVPPTGTPIKLVNGDIMRNLLIEYTSEIFYLGRAYGSTILLPMWFKHFGSVKEGAGEAYHIGIFGKTGSGKSILAKMIMLAYARHRTMNIFVLDPQGEFTKLKNDSLLLDILTKRLAKQVLFYDLHNLVLSGSELFLRILGISKFFDRLGIFHDDNKERAKLQISQILKGRIRDISINTNEVKPWEYHKKETFDRVLNGLRNPQVISHIYTSKDVQERLRDTLEGSSHDDLYDIWKKIANLFAYEGKNNQIKISDLTKDITENTNGKIVIIDLSETNVPTDILWNDDIKMIVINEFLQSLSKQAQESFKQGRLINTLVIIDEAHRLAPREKPESAELENIKNTFKDAVRTTRKFGLGWLFISQTLSSLDKEIINQIRIYLFGFGLAYGLELQALRELIGGNEEAITLYQSFKDPQSVLGQKEYSFMAIGPISPLSFSGSPLFFQALRYSDELIEANFS